MDTDSLAASTVVAWLIAEEGADDARSEAALRAVLGRLPGPVPPANFRSQVLSAGVRDGVVPASTQGWAQRPARVIAWSLAALAGAVGVAVWLGPVILRQMVRLLNFSVQGFVWIVGGLEGGLDVWSLLVEIGRAVGATLATPQVSGGVVMIELVGIVALYALLRILSLDRKSTR
jgi:hypothetical protein